MPSILLPISFLLPLPPWENLGRSIFGYMNVFGLSDHVHFMEYYKHLDENGKLIASAEQIADGHKLLKNIIFWSQNLRPLREKILLVAKSA